MLSKNNETECREVMGKGKKGRLNGRDKSKE